MHHRHALLAAKSVLCVALLWAAHHSYGVTTTLEYEDLREALARAAVSNELHAACTNLEANIASATNDLALATGTAIATATNELWQSSAAAFMPQTFTESDPTVPAWAKSETPPVTVEQDPVWAAASNGVYTAIANATPADYASVSNRAMSAVQTETDPTIYSWAKADTKPSYTLNEVAPNTENWLGVPGTTIAGKSIKVLAKTVNGVIEGGLTVTSSSNNDNNTTKYCYGGVAVKRDGTNTDYLWDATSQSGIVRRSELGDYATTSALAAKADASQVTTIVNYLEGNDARVIITNYDSQVEMPALSFEQKTGTVWRTIWDEETRWGAHDLDERAYRTATSNSVESLATQLEGKADRAWGFYESHTGNYAPDGYTWISSPKIAIAGGMAYERHITSDGAIWLLESNGLGIELTGTTNGFFRVADDEDNVLFEIVKGERRTVGASGDHVAVTNGTLYAHYSVISAEHPTIYACTNLTTLAGFIAETEQSCPCTVAWSGTSGNWTAAVTAKGPTPNIFAKAEYTVGGETYIHNAAPTKLDYLMIGNTKYSLGTATISGSTVLTLTEVP